MNILFCGSICGKLGREVIKKILPELKEEFSVDFVVANGERAGDDANSILPKDCEELRNLGIDCVTTGECVWNKKEMTKALYNLDESILRPANYPPSLPGKGYSIFLNRICVINLQGRAFMPIIDCPFRKFDEIYETIKDKTKIIIVDFHAQASAEKNAFSWYVNGRASCVIGTHVRVQTADERILSKGTGMLTDVGLVGAHDAIGGLKVGSVLKMFVSGVPFKTIPANSSPGFEGVLIQIEDENGKCKKLDRLQIRL